MDKDKTFGYILGQRSAWLHVLGECLRQLGYDSSEFARLAWIKEREKAVAMLRTTCDGYGDNDWGYDLNLADVIEKHLLRHLGDK